MNLKLDKHGILIQKPINIIGKSKKELSALANYFHSKPNGYFYFHSEWSYETEDYVSRIYYNGDLVISQTYTIDGQEYNIEDEI